MESNFIDELAKQIAEKTEEMIIDDIFLIHANHWESYQDYQTEKQRLAQSARDLNMNKMFNSDQNKLNCNYYIEPNILSEHLFNYIRRNK